MIFLGLGSNIGDKVANIVRALKLLEAGGVTINRVSSFYQTPPWGIRDQEAFINIVCEVDFVGAPEELLDICLHIEEKMGRKRIIKWGPRLIDIDIIEFHREMIQTPTLTLPHPYYLERDFVLVPLAELAPHWQPTGHTEAIQAYLVEMDTTACVRVEVGREMGKWGIGK